jgi:hypothetical protein
MKRVLIATAIILASGSLALAQKGGGGGGGSPGGTSSGGGGGGGGADPGFGIDIDIPGIFPRGGPGSGTGNWPWAGSVQGCCGAGLRSRAARGM